MSLRGGPGTGNEAGLEPAPGEAASERSASAGESSSAAHVLSADELLALVEPGTEWIWETDHELRFSWLSSNYQDATGIAPDSVLGHFRFDFLRRVAKGSADAEAHLADLEARRPFRNFVYELSGGKPECRWVAITGYPRFGGDGAFIGYRGIGRNVTAVAAAVHELESGHVRIARDAGRAKVISDSLAGESHAERMMAALNVMKDAFCYYDSSDRLVLYNEAMLDLYRGLADVIRPGICYEDLYDIGMARGLWVTDGDDPAQLREQMLSRRRNERQWQATVKTSEGRWVMHREMRTEDGGAIGISTDVTDLKQRQEEADRANETASLLVSDLERTLDSLRMGVVLLDASLNAQIINKAFYDIWKIGPADVSVGSPFRALMDVNRNNGIYDVAEDRWEGYVASRLAEIKAGDVAPREFARADGRTMIYSVTALSGGRRLVSYYDVTEMKNREADLADAKDKAAELFSNLRRMVDSMSIGIVVLDPELKTEIINQAFYDLWRIDPAKVAEGSTFRDLMEASRGIDAHGIDDADWQAHIATRESELRSGRTASRELERSDGRAMICNMAPLSGGKVLVSYVDVTEMKDREAELADALEKSKLAEAVIDGVRDPVFVKDSQLKFVIANRAFSDMFGLDPEAMVGRSDRDFFPDSEAARFAAAERQVLATGEALEFEEDAQFSGADRTRIVRKNRISTSSGKDYVAGFLFDVTEMKRRELEADEARRQLADVLERMPAAVVIYDRADNLLFANRKMQESLPALEGIWQKGTHAARRFRSRPFRRLLPLQRRFRRSTSSTMSTKRAGSRESLRAIICGISSSSAGTPTAAGTRPTTCVPMTAHSSGCASTSPNSSGGKRRCATRCARSTCSGTCSTSCPSPPSSRRTICASNMSTRPGPRFPGFPRKRRSATPIWSCSAATRRKPTRRATPRPAPAARSWRRKSQSSTATAPSGS